MAEQQEKATITHTMIVLEEALTDQDGNPLPLVRPSPVDDPELQRKKKKGKKGKDGKKGGKDGKEGGKDGKEREKDRKEGGKDGKEEEEDHDDTLSDDDETQLDGSARDKKKNDQKDLLTDETWNSKKNKTPEDQAPVYKTPEDQAPIYRTPEDQAPVYKTPEDQAPVYQREDQGPVHQGRPIPTPDQQQLPEDLGAGVDLLRKMISCQEKKPRRIIDHCNDQRGQIDIQVVKTSPSSNMSLCDFPQNTVERVIESFDAMEQKAVKTTKTKSQQLIALEEEEAVLEDFDADTASPKRKNNLNKQV